MHPLLKPVCDLDPLKPYNIAFTGLSIGKHSYRYDVDGSFFECFESTQLGESDIKVEVVLEKSNSMLVLDFNISGRVKLVCDRCSEEYWQEIDANNRLFVKFGETHFEQTENVVVVPRAETHFEVSQYIYEFVHLGLPVKRVHPGGKTKADNCDPQVLKKLKELHVETDEDGNPKTGVTDHWEALRKLKKN